MRSIVGLAVVAAMCAGPAWGQSRNWSTPQFDIAEVDDACVLSSSFAFDGRSDVKLDLIWNGDGVGLALTSSGWSAEDGKEYEGFSYLFRNPDASFSGGKTFGTIFGYIYKGFLTPFDADVLESFASAESLIVLRKVGESEPAIVTHMNLEGSGAAIASLRRCTTHVLRQNAAQARREQEWDYIERDPFAPVTAPSTASPSPILPPPPTFIPKSFEPSEIAPDSSVTAPFAWPGKAD